MSALPSVSSSVHRESVSHLARAILGQGLAAGLLAAALLATTVRILAPAELDRAQDLVGSLLNLFTLGPGLIVVGLVLLTLVLLLITVGRAPLDSVLHLLRMAAVLMVTGPPTYAALLFTGWNGRLHLGVWLGSALVFVGLLALADRSARSRVQRALESTPALVGLALLVVTLLVCSLTRALTPKPAPLPVTTGLSGLPSAEESASLPKLVLMVSIDTLRSDHLSAYGYPRTTSPTFDRLAREGQLLERVIASSSGSLPSLATLLTGLPPWQHGVVDQRGRLARGHATLSERFAAAGFHTTAVVVNPIVEKRTGLDRGFLHFKSFDNLPADEAVERLLATLPSNPETPVFAWLHLYEPHTPYDPPTDLTAEFLEDSLYRQDRLSPIEYGSYGGIRRQRTLGARRTGSRRDLDAGFAEALYDGAILEADQAVGRLLEKLSTRQEPEETVVLYTADHGEELVPSRGKLHFQHALEVGYGSIRIPAVYWAPGRISPGGRRSTVTCQQSLSSLLTAFSGLEAQPREDLAPRDEVCMSQSAWWDELSLWALPLDRRSPTYALVEGRWKLEARFSSEFELISGPASWLGAWRSTLAGLWRPDGLFDVLSDPSEQINRIDDEAAVARRMRRLLLEMSALSHSSDSATAARPER